MGAIPAEYENLMAKKGEIRKSDETYKREVLDMLEIGTTIKAFEKVKAADNPAQMLGELE